MRHSTTNSFKVGAILMLLLFIVSCGGNKLPDNYFKIDDDVYELTSGSIINHGQTNASENLFKLDLRLYNAEKTDFINISFFSETAESISNGTYSFSSQDINASWILGYSSNGSYSSLGQINSGSAVISRSSDGYIIEIEGTDEFSNAIKGHFKGELSKIDENNLVHALPNYVCPEEIYDQVTQYFPIYSGFNPPNMRGEYLSAPNALIYESYAEDPDSVIFFSDRYLGFIYNGKQMNFYGKQYDPEKDRWIEEVYYGLKITGENDYFTCYFVIDDYVEGYYAKQSFIFSGKKTDDGIEDYHSAVILLETSGHPNMPANNSFRVLKDYDGIAEAHNWLSKGNQGKTIDSKDLFKMWIK